MPLNNLVARAIFEEERPDDSYDRFLENNPNPQKYIRMADAAIKVICVELSRSCRWS